MDRNDKSWQLLCQRNKQPLRLAIKKIKRQIKKLRSVHDRKGALRSKDSVFGISVSIPKGLPRSFKMIWIVDQAKKLIYRKYTVDTWFERKSDLELCYTFLVYIFVLKGN